MSKFHALDAKRKGDGFPRREMKSLFSVYSTTALGLFVALTSRLASSISRTKELHLRRE
jgi:hypothetical protein